MAKDMGINVCPCDTAAKRIFILATVSILYLIALAAIPAAGSASSGTTAVQDANSSSEWTNQKKITVTTQNGFIRLGDVGNPIAKFVLDGEDVVIQGHVANNGYWRSTDVDIEDQTIQGFDINLESPEGFEGTYDPANETFTAQGNITLSLVGDSENTVDVPVVLENQGAEDEDEQFRDNFASVTTVSRSFRVPATENELLNEQFQLPLNGWGNSISFDFEVELEEAQPRQGSLERVDNAEEATVQFEPPATIPVTEPISTVKNTGFQPVVVRASTPDAEDFNLRVPSQATVNPGEEKSIEATFNSSQTGIYTTQVTLNATETISGEQVFFEEIEKQAVVTAAPADIQMVDVSIQESEVEVDEPATVVVTAENAGGSTGNREVTVSLGNQTTATNQLEIEPGSEVSEEFTLQSNETGDYTISVGEQTYGELTVTDPQNESAGMASGEESGSPNAQDNTDETGGENETTAESSDGSGPGFTGVLAIGVIISVAVVTGRRACKRPFMRVP